MIKKTVKKAIGVMSGTSLDGIDIIACSFYQNKDKIEFEINAGTTVKYSNTMYDKLLLSSGMTGYELAKLNIIYGREIGNAINEFIEKEKFSPDFIASHGYTVFHQPKNRLTLQIGSGAEISAITKIKTVCDFRTIDVALGGQGAPLVPIGDKLLFGEYESCLNLGGFANISYDNKMGERIAFDICPVNFILNYFSNKLGFDFDNNGNSGRKGKVNKYILDKLNSIDFYQQNGPKSLGREFVEDNIFNVFNAADISMYDALRTSYEHIAIQLSSILNTLNNKKVLVTGGGAYNNFLIELIEKYTKAVIVVPNSDIVDYKEALIFAFLGLLRIDDKINCLKSVTGAVSNNIGGCIY